MKENLMVIVSYMLVLIFCYTKNFVNNFICLFFFTFSACTLTYLYTLEFWGLSLMIVVMATGLFLIFAYISCINPNFPDAFFFIDKKKIFKLFVLFCVFFFFSNFFFKNYIIDLFKISPMSFDHVHIVYDVTEYYIELFIIILLLILIIFFMRFTYFNGGGMRKKF